MTAGRDDDVERLVADFQKSGLRELHVRSDNFELYLSDDASAAGLDNPAAEAKRADPPAPISPPAGVPVVATEEPEATPAALPDDAVVVRAPYLGTFYRSPKPGSDPYVELGQRVEAETEVCLVEVMKLFTAVRAGTTGTIHAILARDGEMVVADQPLFAILPA